MTDRVGVSGETADEFAVLDAGRVRERHLLGKKIEVRPLTVGQLPRFARTLRPVLGPLTETINRAFAGDDEAAFSIDTAVDLIENHGDALIEAVAVAIQETPETVSEAELDEFTELVIAVLAVNLDFFVQRLLPNLAGHVNELAVHLQEIGGSGRIRSSSSNGTGTH